MGDEKKNIPFEYELMDPEENRALWESMKGFMLNYATVGPQKYFLSEYFMEQSANIYNFPLRSDDIFVATFPKSGTTWTQELVWLLQNNLDFERAKSEQLTIRFPFLEITSVISPDAFLQIPEEVRDSAIKAIMPMNLKKISELPSPRFIKSHLPLSILPPALLDTVKVLYVARDPRDVAVSYYHHDKLTRAIGPDTEFKPYWNQFLKGQVLWAPYFSHVLEAWHKRNHPNLLFLFYEHLLEDLSAGIRRVAQFLGKEVTEQQVSALNDFLQFDNFKKNKSVNLKDFQENGVLSPEGDFVRKGKSGGWHEYFDEEMTAQADKWIEDNLRGTDFKLPH